VAAKAQSHGGRSPGVLGRAWSGAPPPCGEGGALKSWLPPAIGCGVRPPLGWLASPGPSGMASFRPTSTSTGGRAQGREGNEPGSGSCSGSLSRFPKSLQKAIRQGAGTPFATQAPRARWGWRSRTASRLFPPVGDSGAASQRLPFQGALPLLTAQDGTLAPWTDFRCSWWGFPDPGRPSISGSWKPIPASSSPTKPRFSCSLPTWSRKAGGVWWKAITLEKPRRARGGNSPSPCEKPLPRLLRCHSEKGKLKNLAYRGDKHLHYGNCIIFFWSFTLTLFSFLACAIPGTWRAHLPE
jgi:hypothetical protein